MDHPKSNYQVEFRTSTNQKHYTLGVQRIQIPDFLAIINIYFVYLIKPLKVLRTCDCVCVGSKDIIAVSQGNFS